MKEQEGIWVHKSLLTSKGEVVISMRLDNAIDPELMCNKLEKEGEALRKQMFKILDKLNLLNDKTPDRIMNAAIAELAENQKLHGHYMTEYSRWSEALRLKNFGK